jgi:hypothetical protein
MHQAPARAALVAAFAILFLTACPGPAPAPGPGAIPDVCPGAVRVEVTNNSASAVDIWWMYEGSRRYLGSAPPGVSFHVPSDAAGTPRFEVGGRQVTGRQAGQINYRLLCM